VKRAALDEKVLPVWSTRSYNHHQATRDLRDFYCHVACTCNFSDEGCVLLILYEQSFSCSQNFRSGI